MSDKITTPLATKAASKGKHLTAAETAEAIALWKSGTVTIADLSKRFKKSRNTFMRIFEKEGVKKGETASETKKKVADEIEKATVDDAAEMAKRIRDTKENTYKMAQLIERSMAAEIVEARTSKTPMGLREKNIKVWKDIAATLEITRAIRYEVLGLNDKDANKLTEIPDLEIRELTVEQIMAEQKKGLEESQQDDMDMPDVDLDDFGDEDDEFPDDDEEDEVTT
jgi:AraC-like DNA-binding protein